MQYSRASACGRAEHYWPSHLVTLKWLTADGCARSTLESSSGGRARIKGQRLQQEMRDVASSVEGREMRAFSSVDQRSE